MNEYHLCFCMSHECDFKYTSVIIYVYIYICIIHMRLHSCLIVQIECFYVLLITDGVEYPHVDVSTYVQIEIYVHLHIHIYLYMISFVGYCVYGYMIYMLSFHMYEWLFSLSSLSSSSLSLRL